MDKDLSAFYKQQAVDAESEAPDDGPCTTLDDLRDTKSDSQYIHQTSMCVEEILNRLESMEASNKVESKKNTAILIVAIITVLVTVAPRIIRLFL